MNSIDYNTGRTSYACVSNLTKKIKINGKVFEQTGLYFADDFSAKKNVDIMKTPSTVFEIVKNGNFFYTYKRKKK